MVDARPPASSARWRPARSSAASAQRLAGGQSSAPVRSTVHASRCIICTMAYRAGVVGGSGYTGAELLRLLAGHPEIEVVHVTADSQRGRGAWASCTRRSRPAYGDLRFAPLDAADLAGLDLVFCALPHGASQALAARPARSRRPRRSTSAPTSGCRPTCTRAGTARRTTRPRSSTGSRTGSSSCTATRSRRTRTSRRPVAIRPR